MQPVIDAWRERWRQWGFTPTLLLFVVALLGLPVALARYYSSPGDGSVMALAADGAALLAYLAFFVASGVLALREYRQSISRLRVANEALQRSREALDRRSQELASKLEEMRTLTTVLDKAPFGVSFADPSAEDMPLVYVNDAFCRITGYFPEEVVGRNCRFLQGEGTSPEAAARIRDAIRKEATIELEILNYRKNGDRFWNRFLLFPTYDLEGSLLHYVGCQTDITAYKLAEAEQLRVAGELQESLKLESLGLTIAGIAHDLNTPIGVAITAASHLEQASRQIAGLADGQPPSAEALERYSGSVLRASGLIRNNLSKAALLVRSFKQTSADATRNEWRDLHLKAFLETLLVSVSPIMKRARCEVRLDCPEALSIHTEPGSLGQAITNLLVNATIHAFEGIDERRVTITVAVAAHRVRLDIADNGKGMTEEAAAKAFTPFFTTRRTSGGSGLGLFSCRRVVEQVLGGSIAFETRLGQGTTFHIDLPLRGAAPTREAPTGAPA